MSSLEKIEWSDGLSIGNANIDKDHKKLITIYNELVDLVEQQQSREDFARILSGMTDYALLHFKKEEKYMKDFSYPGFAEHLQLHMEYIYRVSMFNIELHRYSTTDPNDVIHFIEQWWVNHIMDNDKEYEKYKQSIHSDAYYKGV